MGLFQACSSKYANRNPMTELFPTVTGKRLDGKKVELPKDLGASPAILIVGYKQNSQFDIDRWLLGLYDSKVETPVYEIPTVVGMFPGMMSKRIDEGMKSGIPEELWVSVVTVYKGEAKKVVRFTGNEDALNARVMLLDGKGNVRFFHDRGYSAIHLRQLTELLNGTL
jgi:hypothetical protein